MKIFITFILSITIINSCTSIKKSHNEIYYQDILDFDSQDKKEIQEQIEIRKKKILEVTNNIDKLNSYTMKISQRADFEYLYGKDNSTIQKYLDNTQKEINKYKLIHSRLIKEIRVLERKKNLNY
jgi:hypothetical protein